MLAAGLQDMIGLKKNAQRNVIAAPAEKTAVLPRRRTILRQHSRKPKDDEDVCRITQITGLAFASTGAVSLV